MTAFGIDFGTTNSVLASCTAGDVATIALGEPPADWASLGFDRVLPSVVAIRELEAIVGWQAKSSPSEKVAAVKRLFATDDLVQLGGKSMAVEQVGALIFRHIQKRAQDDGLSLDHAVVTIPANSRGRARMLTKVAAGLAGIEVAALINEPTAAAMAYGRGIHDGQSVLVFDWGGGTLDVTVLLREHGVFIERASKGIQQLGGLDIDRALADALKPQIEGATKWDGPEADSFLLEIERAKVILSNQASTVIVTPDGQTVELGRDDLARAIQPLVERTREPIDRCLSDLGGSISIDHVVLVGGSSKIPAVRDFVSEVVGQAPMSSVDPMTAVAEGAALAAAILLDEVEDLDFFVATEHALGTIAVDAHTGQDEFSVLIPRNNMLPAEETDFYVPALDHQEVVSVRVVEGDPSQPLDHEDNVVLKDWEVQLAEPRPRDEAGISITYRYNVDGILRVVVKDVKTEEVLLDDELAFGPDRKRKLREMRREIDSLSSGRSAVTPERSDGSQGGLDAESEALIGRVEQKIIPFVDETDAAQLVEVIADLRASAVDQRDECRRRLGTAMREHAYLL